MATYITQRVSAAWRNILEEKQWNYVGLRQEDASETKGKGLQNCDQTSCVVWCIDLGKNERTRSETRST